MKWVMPGNPYANPPAIIDGTMPPRPDQLLAGGFRMWDETVPETPAGQYIVSWKFAQDGGDPRKAVVECVYGSIAERDAAEAAAREAAKESAATLDNGDVLLRAAAGEIIAKIEAIKAIIRTAHPASASAIPAMSAAEWVAAIKARARGLMP